MRRYAAFLRGVSPMNAKMPELKRCFEAAGFTDVKTVLSSGNVVFSARASSEASLERKAETEIELKDGQGFGIAGLLDHRTTVQLNKVPGIADIPVLGQLFRSRSVNRSNQELLVLVTPRIVDPARIAPPSPALPKQPVPFLNIPGFDRGLPKGEGSGKTPEKTSPK